MIRAIVVDDEDLARERIRTLLDGYDDVEVVREYASASAVLKEIDDLRPDLMFLDVQMPGIDGFSLLEALRDESRPFVIFVTAFDEHAVRAFDVNALDYLLKPFTKERFDRAVDRVRSQATAGPNQAYRARIAAALGEVQRGRARTRVPIKTEDGTTFVPIDAIDWVEADGNYVRVHAGGSTALVRDTMTHFCERLPSSFLRIARSLVVNVDRIARVEPWAHGEHVVVMRDGAKLKSGRAYSEALGSLLRS